MSFCFDDSLYHIKDHLIKIRKKMKHMLPWIILALALLVVTCGSPVFPSNLLSHYSSSGNNNGASNYSPVDWKLPNPERRFKLRMQRSLFEEDVQDTHHNGRNVDTYNVSKHNMRRMNSLRDLIELNKTLSAPPGNKWKDATNDTLESDAGGDSNGGSGGGNGSGNGGGNGSGNGGGKRRLMNVHHYMSIRGGNDGSSRRSGDGLSESANNTAAAAAVHITTVIPLGDIQNVFIDEDLHDIEGDLEEDLQWVKKKSGNCHSIYCVIVSTVSESIHNISSLLASHVKIQTNITSALGEDAP